MSLNKKTELLETIASQNRGLLVNDIEKVKVLSLVEQIEDCNPTPEPLKAKDLLEGNWRLLYTTSKGLLSLDRIPLLQLGQIYQCIRTATAKLYNIAEIVGLPFLEGLVCVTATFEPVSVRRVNVRFDRSIISLQRPIGYRSPDRFIQDLEAGKKFLPLDFSLENRDQKGWLDITYLDENMRIGRGNEGSLFILAKEK